MTPHPKLKEDPSEAHSVPQQCYHPNHLHTIFHQPTLLQELRNRLWRPGRLNSIQGLQDFWIQLVLSILEKILF